MAKPITEEQEKHFLAVNIYGLSIWLMNERILHRYEGLSGRIGATLFVEFREDFIYQYPILPDTDIKEIKAEIFKVMEKLENEGIRTFSTSTQRYSSRYVSVREGPGTEYDVIGSLSFAQQVTIIGQADKEWCRIQYGSKTGYVLGKFLVKEKPEPKRMFLGNLKDWDVVLESFLGRDYEKRRKS